VKEKEFDREIMQIGKNVVTFYMCIGRFINIDVDIDFDINND